MLSFENAILLKAICIYENNEKSFYKYLLSEDDFLPQYKTGYMIDGFLFNKYVSYKDGRYRITENGRDALAEAIVYYKYKARFLLEDSTE